MNTKYIQIITLFSQVIVPELKNSKNIEKKFIHNFLSIIHGLEDQSSSKIKLLILIIDKLSYLYNFKSFAKLNNQQRNNYINKLFNFPIGKIIAGLTGLRSIVFIAYYGIEDIWETINYQGPIKS